MLLSLFPSFFLSSQFIIELAFPDGERFMSYLPSMLAASAVLVARHVLDLKPLWVRAYILGLYITIMIVIVLILEFTFSLVLSSFQNPTLDYYTSLTVSKMAPCVQDLFGALQRSATAQQQAVREKYSHSKFHRVSAIPVCSHMCLLVFL
jgi:hypothetical protein